MTELTLRVRMLEESIHCKGCGNGCILANRRGYEEIISLGHRVKRWDSRREDGHSHKNWGGQG